MSPFPFKSLADNSNFDVPGLKSVALRSSVPSENPQQFREKTELQIFGRWMIQTRNKNSNLLHTKFQLKGVITAISHKAETDSNHVTFIPHEALITSTKLPLDRTVLKRGVLESDQH